MTTLIRAFLVSLAILISSMANAMNREDMEDIIRQRACRSDYTKLSSRTLQEMCGDSNNSGIIEFNECLNKWQSEDRFTYKWNSFVDKCNELSKKAGSYYSPSKPPASENAPTGSSDLERALVRQRAKATDAAAINARNKQKADSFVKSSDSEMRTLRWIHDAEVRRKNLEAQKAADEAKRRAAEIDRRNMRRDFDRVGPAGCRSPVDYRACVYQGENGLGGGSASFCSSQFCN